MPLPVFYRRASGSLLYVVAVLLLGAAFARYVIQDFHGPMMARVSGDADIHAYQGYYVLHHLHFVPWPELDLDNNALLYPYGNDQVFQSWVFERDLFSALCLKMLGQGPWVQIHYLASVLITALGLYFLLRREYSQTRAAFAGLVVAFCNYYPIAKFPGHANLAVLHWTMLGIAADHLLARRVWRGESFSARLWLLRMALLFLAFGQEMGYVAGLSLTSFLLTFIWVAGVVCRRRPLSWSLMLNRSREILNRASHDLRAHPWQTAALTFALAWGTFMYFPLAAQVFHHARQYRAEEIMTGEWWQWANPLRIFIPIVPGLEPVGSPGNFEKLVSLFNDNPEGFFAMSPGLSFVLFGALGIVLARRNKNLWALVPLLVLWGLILANHPGKFPTLRIFPWFAYARTTAKLGDINCLALVLTGIGGIPAGYFLGQRAANSLPRSGRLIGRRMLAGGLALLFGVEAITAYRVNLMRDREYFVPGKEFVRFMETIRQAPGEALFEWPFCVAAGNGFPTRELGPYYRKQSTLFCLSEFHEKRVISGYYGRLFPQQAAPFFHAGWNALFDPDHHGIMEANRQKCDFDAAEWSFFETFYRKNDFCGLLLSTDFLTTQTVHEMHRRLGPPAAVESSGPHGRMEFIPRPADWGRPANPEEGKRVAFSVPLSLPVTHIDFTQDSALLYLRDGWSRLIRPAPRYTEGSRALVVFSGVPSARPKSLLIDLLATTYEAQSFTLGFNGRAVQTWCCDGKELHHFRAILPASAWREGANEITFDLPQAHPLRWKWNRTSDTRAFGLKVDSMDIREEASVN